MTEVILITLLVVALFYIFFIRPARSEERRRQHDLNELQIGDTVLTRGGLIAEVDGVETPGDGPMIVLLRLSDDVVVRAHTSAVTERLKPAQPLEVDENEPDDEQDDERW